MSLLSTWLNRLEKSVPPLCLCQWGRSDPCVYLRNTAFMPRLLHLYTEPLTFPFVSGALHTGAFNSLTISASSQTSCIISPDFPISGGLIINVLQELRIRCRGVYADTRDARQGNSIKCSNCDWRQLNSNKQIWVSFTKTFPPAASGTQVYLWVCPVRKQVLFY